MNRGDSGRGADPLQQTSSSTYLIYLFIVSASLIVLLPYLLPIRGALLRTNKKETATETVRSKTSPMFSSDVVLPGMYNSHSAYEDLEMLVVDLQRVLHAERERIMLLENEVQLLHLSERYLKDRVEKLEDENFEIRRRVSDGSSPLKLLMEKSIAVQSKQDSMDMYVQELLRMVQAEKEKTTALISEINILRTSESMLVDRIKALEEKFGQFMSNQRQTYFYDHRYDKKDSKDL